MDFKGLAQKVMKPLKYASLIGATGLVGLTLIKDNVHFGSTTLVSPQRNQYIWGFCPQTTIMGTNTRANVSTFGLITSNKGEDITGNVSSYGLLISGNKIVNIRGNVSSYGLLSINNSTNIMGNVSSYGIIIAFNRVSEIRENQQAYGLFNSGTIIRSEANPKK